MTHVLLDTHAVLWWKAAGRSRLSRKATSAIDQVATVLISPVSCWEIATLVRLGRVELDRDVSRWVRGLLAEPDVEVAALSPIAAADAGRIEDFHGDPADRLLYATARELRVPLVSKDQRLRSHADRTGDVDVIW